MTKHKNKSEAKKKAQVIIFEYLSNSENPIITRGEYASDLLHVARQSLYSMFTPAELSAIELDALRVRREQYAVESMKVDKGLIRRAKDGDAPAAKLYYQRLEGWAPTVNVMPMVDFDKLTRSQMERIKAGESVLAVLNEPAEIEKTVQ